MKPLDSRNDVDPLLYLNTRRQTLPRKPFARGVDQATLAVVLALIFAIVAAVGAWVFSDSVVAEIPPEPVLNCFTGKTTGC